MLVKKSSPLAPFPAIDPAQLTLEWEKAHAAEIDAWFGIDTFTTESRLPRKADPDQETWTGTDPQIFLTPYTELRWVLTRLTQSPNPISHFVDLGAGYGRMGLVMAEHLPKARFTGIELLDDRIAASRHLKHVWQKHHREMICADLSSPDFILPHASHYFIYDFGSVRAIDRCLEKLRYQAKLAPFCLIGRGRRIRDRIQAEHPWLSGEKAPEHHSRLSFYGAF